MQMQHSLLAAALIASTLACSSHGQAWDTVISADMGGGKPSVLLVDPFSQWESLPGLFVAGGSYCYLDQTTTPATFSQIADVSGNATGFAVSGQGDIYTSRQSWEIRKSSDQGISWNLIDAGALWSPKVQATACDVAADASGNVYATGYLEKANGQYWIIRRGTNGGSAWNTVYTAPKQLSHGRGIEVVPAVAGKHAGGLFAVGDIPSGAYSQWTVLRSRDAGATWATVDSWKPAKNMAGGARVIASTPQGRIFVAGVNAGSPTGWWVRKSEDGGNSWQTILSNYSYGTTSSVETPSAIVSDPFGNVFLTGPKQSSGGVYAATVRRWDAASQSWDNWPDSMKHPLLRTHANSTSYSLAADALGNIYLGSASYPFWIVQRLSAP